MNDKIFSGSIRLSNSDSSIDEDRDRLNYMAKMNDWMVGNSYYCYIYGSLVLLINPSELELKTFKSLFNDGGRGIKPLSLDNQPE